MTDSVASYKEMCFRRTNVCLLLCQQSKQVQTVQNILQDHLRGIDTSIQKYCSTLVYG